MLPAPSTARPGRGITVTIEFMRLPAPTPTPDRRARFNLRTAVIAALAGALTLVTVIGGVLLITGGTNYARPSRIDYPYYAVPSDSWANGSTKQWTSTIDTDASIFTSADHLFSVKPDGDGTQNSTLTAYTMSDSGVSKAWSTTVDTSKDSVAGLSAKNNPVYPAFLIWGKNTLIHGRNIYNITTGDTSDAPWPEDAVPVVAGDVVVACQKTTCAGYREGNTSSMWSTAVNDPSTFSEQSTDVAENILKYGQHYETVQVFSGEKYATIAGLYAINISTGKMVEFTLPEKKTSQYITVSTDKGWSVVSKDKATGEWHISFYEENGGDPTSTDTLRRDFDTQPIYLPGPRSAQGFRSLWVDDDPASLAGTINFTSEGDKECAKTISMTNAAAIDLTGFDTTTFPCFDQDDTQVSDHAKVVTVGMKQSVNAAPFSLMYDAATGQQIDFEGMDPNSGAVFAFVDSKKIVGYSPADGTLTSYKPSFR